MIYNQVGSGWRAGSGHGLEGASRPARGSVRCGAYTASVLALLILILHKEAVS